MNFESGLQRLADSYRAQGYDVTVRPRPDQLPVFAKDFVVEILGRRETGGVLVTVKKNREELSAHPAIARYAEVTGAEAGWRFDLAVLEGENPNTRDLRGAREFSAEDVRQAVNQAGELTRLGYARPAVVSAWAALEAAMRLRLRALGQEAGWKSTPGQMLRELYSAGAFTPDEFQHLETASQLRNQIIHGFSPPAPGEDAPVVRLLSEVASRLVTESQTELQTV